jgi:hypothetical protein
MMHRLILFDSGNLLILLRRLLGKTKAIAHARAFSLNRSSGRGLSILLRFLHSLHFTWKQIPLALPHICAWAVTPIILTRHRNHEWLVRIADSFAISGDLATGMRIEAQNFFVGGGTLFVGGIVVMAELMRATG